MIMDQGNQCLDGTRDPGFQDTHLKLIPRHLGIRYSVVNVSGERKGISK